MAAPGVDILTTDRGRRLPDRSPAPRRRRPRSRARPPAAGDRSGGHERRDRRPPRAQRRAAGTRGETGNGRLDLARRGRPTRAPRDRAGGRRRGRGRRPLRRAVRGGGRADLDGRRRRQQLDARPANWGGTAPVAGDDLVFPAGAARLSNTNDFGDGTAFNSITISGTGYTLAGNRIALGAGDLASTAVGSANTDQPPAVLRGHGLDHGDVGDVDRSRCRAGVTALAA